MSSSLDRPSSRLAILVSVALMAGASGALAAFLLLVPSAPPVETPPVRVPIPVRLSDSSAPRVPVVSVSIVPRKALRPVPGGTAVADGDLIGTATVLTSDGWLVADRASYERIVDPVALLPDGAVAASSTVADAATGLIFFRVNAKGLDVVAFEDSAGLAPGTTLYRAAPGKALAPVGLLTAHARLRADARDAVRQSSAVAERLRLAAPAALAEAGAGLLTSRGALAGILVSVPKQDEVRLAVPIEAVARALRDVVRSGAAHRPSLGLATADLSELATRDEGLADAFGALVVSVDPAGPAAAALKAGDRLVALGSDALDGSRLLSDLLASYRIGETVTLTLVRDGAERKADLVIGESKETGKRKE